MLRSTSGRNRTTFKLRDDREPFSIEMTSITAPQAQLRATTRTLAEVDHVFYVVSLCSYCATLSGPSSYNQMEASLKLFSLMSRLNVLRTIPITIFFTQADIFPQRIVDVPIRHHFPDYRGGTHAQWAYEFFAWQFRIRDHRRDAQLHMFAPGLNGSTSLQETLDEVQNLILRDLHDG